MLNIRKENLIVENQSKYKRLERVEVSHEKMTHLGFIFEFLICEFK